MNKNKYELINKAKLELIDIDNTLDSLSNKDFQISLIEIDLLKDKVKELYNNIDKMKVFTQENFIKHQDMPDLPILNNENDYNEDNKDEIIENNEDDLLKNNDFSIENDTLILTEEEKTEEIVEKEEIDTSTPSDIDIDFFGQEEAEETIEEEKVIINEDIIEEDIALDIKEEVVEQEEEEIIVEEVIEEEVVEEIIVEQQPEQEYIEEKTVEAEDKKENNILADKFTQNSHSLIDEIPNNINSLGEKMRDKPISDINSSISMNDRFWLQKELFNGKQEDLFIAINKLNSCSDITEAINSFTKISKKHKWDEENRAVIKLKKLVERRYL